jgi:ABC-2 type transport system ATP-binding protein
MLPTVPADPSNSLLTVAGFSKRYGTVAALTDVTFSIRPGEVLGLIGPNGAGKTTLFECVAGMLHPSSGQLIQAGRPLAPRDRSALLFYLPDAIAPWPSQTVRWALEFIVGFFDGRADDVDGVVRDLALGPLMDAPMGHLSKGQRKRALLGLGLLTPQRILLIDEPFDGLDLRQSREVSALLRAQCARGRTLFVSIHQIADAARVCDRFVLLSGGRVCGEGTLDDLMTLAAARGRADADRSLEEVFLALT